MTVFRHVAPGVLQATYALLAFTLACASTPISRRTQAIQDADREAQRALAVEAQIDAARIPARSLGVLPFTVPPGDTLLGPLGYAIADFMTTDLATSPELQLVDRLHTDAVVRELDLVDKGVVDPRSAPRVGRLVGARRLLIGEIRPGQGGTVVVSARLVDVLAGTVRVLVSATAPLDRAIEAEKVLALRVFEELGIVLTPTQTAAVQQRATTNLAATVAYGRGLEAEARADVPRAVAAFQEAARLDAAFTAARTQLAGASPVVSTHRGTGVQRVLNLSAQAINAPVATKLPEAADAPLQAGQMLLLLINVRIF